MNHSPANIDGTIEAHLRDRLIESLRLWASPSEQTEYQKSVPHVSVPDEMENQWFDVADHGYLEQIGRPTFLDEEVRALQLFDVALKHFCSTTPHCLPNLVDLQSTRSFQSVNAAAKKALLAFSDRERKTN